MSASCCQVIWFCDGIPITFREQGFKCGKGLQCLNNLVNTFSFPVSLSSLDDIWCHPLSKDVDTCWSFIAILKSKKVYYWPVKALEIGILILNYLVESEISFPVCLQKLRKLIFCHNKNQRGCNAQNMLCMMIMKDWFWHSPHPLCFNCFRVYPDSSEPKVKYISGLLQSDIWSLTTEKLAVSDHCIHSVWLLYPIVGMYVGVYLATVSYHASVACIAFALIVSIPLTRQDSYSSDCDCAPEWVWTEVCWSEQFEIQGDPWSLCIKGGGKKW